MARFSKTQWLLIAGALTVTVLIYIAPRVTDPEAEQKSQAEARFDGESLAEKAKGFLTDSLRQVEEKFSKLAESNEPGAQNAGYDSLSVFWFNLGQPVLAAVYAEQAAEISGKKEDWQAAADKFLQAARNTQDESRSSLYSTAIRCYETAIERGATDLDLRVDLASCYVEGGAEPMKGIGMLKEVLQADSNNIKAQLNLAYFSVRSEQFDLAIERFRKVLELDPSYHDAYVYLGDIYERTGDIENAIIQYETFRKTVTDSTVAGQIDRYLEKLRNSINQ